MPVPAKVVASASALSGRRLEHGAELLGEQPREHVGVQRGDVEVGAAAAREQHLEQRDDEAAVAAVVVRGDPAGVSELLHAAIQ